MKIDDYRLAFPTEVTEATARFAQGDVIDAPPLAYHTVGRYPLWSLSRNAPANDDISLVELSGIGFRFGIITTQTCDITEEDSQAPRKPWIQVAPVYDWKELDNIRKASIDALANADFVHLTGERFRDGFFVADLRISLPLEKSVLVGRNPIAGFATPADQMSFANHCAAYLNRPALPPLVHKHIVKHLRRFFEKRAALRADCSQAEVRELFVKIGGSEMAPIVQVVVLLRQRGAEQENLAKAVFERWWDVARKHAEGDPITLLGNLYATLSDLSGEEFATLVPLRLDLIAGP